MRTRSFAPVMLLAACAQLAASAGAQSESVHHSPGGMRIAVMDAAGDAIRGAEIELPTLEVKFPVPEGGLLLINHVPAGMYVVQVRRLGYSMQTRLVTVHADTPSVRFALDRVATALDTVNVTATENVSLRDFERRLRAGHGKFFTASDIEKTHAVFLTQFLETVHGVKLQAVSGGYSERSPMGAAGMCPSGVLVYLDGAAVNALEDSDPVRAFRAFAPIPIRTTQSTTAATTGSSSGSTAGRGSGGGVLSSAIAAAQAGATVNPNRSSGALPPFDINSISISQIAAMEVYPKGAPAQLQYGSGSPCGVVLLWSKPR